MLIIFGGLPGAGKTSLAKALARQIQAVHIRIDTIEAAIRSVMPMNDVRDTGYRVGYGLASDNLALGLTVIADSVNPLAVTREAWRSVAEKAACPAMEIEVTCSDKAEHRRRVESRAPDIAELTLPTWQDVLEREYEPWTTAPLVLDTAAQDVQTCTTEIHRAIHTKVREFLRHPVEKAMRESLTRYAELYQRLADGD